MNLSFKRNTGRIPCPHGQGSVYRNTPLLTGKNSTPAHVRKLGKWITSIRNNYLLHVNLIACNPAVGKAAEPKEETVKKFAKGLQGLNINVTIRKSLGLDISAACGQLAAQPARRKNETYLYLSRSCFTFRLRYFNRQSGLYTNRAAEPFPYKLRTIKRCPFLLPARKLKDPGPALACIV